ncbi:DUF1971 domain-containing protein [Sphingomonas faeni]|nr:DUF1971 domain-containing protein [Sphingomonas faeni]MCP8890180.1 DUF1971 domain-containing protein [Sphingomonas faeni]
MDINTPSQSPNELPEGLVLYRQTDIFTESSVPAGLLRDHCTKAGVWGLIQVAEGRLRYHVTDQRRTGAVSILAPDCAPGVVEPTILHCVEPLGPVRFLVQFYRRAPEPIPLCSHEEMARRENEHRAAILASVDRLAVSQS